MPDLLSQAMVALRDAAPDGFFVGGCVRDWLLGRPLKDLDVVVPEPVETTGREVARAVGGVFFWLREAMHVGRIMVRCESPLQIDLVPLAGSLEEDLRRRDFTINAMAVPAPEGLLPGAPIIDPTGGKVDLEHRWLRLAAPDALERDPLRCMRAFRLRTLLGLTFAPGLEAAIRIAGPALGRISGERIRDELFVLLEGNQSAPVMAELLAHHLVAPWSTELAASAAGAGLPAVILPSQESESTAAREAGSSKPVGLPSSGLTLLRNLDRWLASRAPLLPCEADLAATLDSQVTPQRSRRALVRLAALSIHARAATSSIARSLSLSDDESRVLARAVGGAQALEEAQPSAGSDRLRFFQRWEPGAVEAVVLALGDRHARQGLVEELRSGGQADLLLILLADVLERRMRPRPPLLTGDDIMAICRLSPGPAVGRWLQQVEEERADGRLHTPEEAREWLRRRSEAEARGAET